MEIHSLRPSSQVDDVIGSDSLAHIEWSNEILKSKCLQILKKEFYPFTSVPYEDFNKTFEKAKQEKKLVHHILLWGALDDQSC